MLITLQPPPITTTAIQSAMAMVLKAMPASQRSCDHAQIHIVTTKGASMLLNKLNNLFQNVNITDEGIKKVQACRYVNINKSELWQALPEYTSKTYDNWKKAVLALYPGATEDCKWSMADLD